MSRRSSPTYQQAAADSSSTSAARNSGAGCGFVCGDTTPHTKPHPAPLLRAAEVLELSAAACWYVGDDLRDIQAARACGMRAVAVEWGYHSPDNAGPRAWNADLVLSQPLELIEHL